MKVTCQSCQAKYTIADEKVRGKVAKIRCKKCGTTIIVDGAEGQPTVATAEGPVDVTGQSADEQWSIVVAEGDEREVTVSQLAELYAAGTINDSTLAWKQGMPDWQSIREIADLRSVADANRGSLSAADAIALSSPPPRSGAAVDSAPLSRARPGEAVAARRAGRTGAADLFATTNDDVTTSAAVSPLTAAPIEDRPTGARNENSVLFSLSALTGGAPSASPGFGQQPDTTPESARADLSALVRNVERPIAPAKNKLDDIMNLGGGALYSPALMAPSLTAPSVEFSTSGDGGSETQRKTKNRIIFGLGGAVILGGAIAAFGAMSSSSPEKPKTTAAADTAVTGAPSAALAAAATIGEPTPDKPTSETAAPAAPAPEAPPTAIAPGQTAPKPEPEKRAKAERAEKAEKADKPDAPAAVAAPAPRAAAAPAAASTADFDRAAALSALSAAATAAQSCKRPDGPTGGGRITVTFANNGAATSAAVEGPPFAGTPVGGCVAARFRGTHVPAFAGSPVTVHKSFTIN